MRFPRIIWRYLLVDVATHAAIGLLALTLLIAVGNVLRFLEDVAGSGVGLSVLGQLMLAILPTFLSYSIPTALVFGILITLGRMGSDGELVALRGSGLSVAQLLPPVLALAAVAAMATAWLMAEVTPRSYARMKQIARDLSSTAALFHPGEFRDLAGRVVYYRAAGEPGCPLRGVLISGSDSGKQLVVNGACGEIGDEGPESLLTLRLRQGSIHLTEGPAEKYRMIRFDSLEMPLEVPERLVGRRWPREFTTLELVELTERGDRPAEWMHSLWIEVHGRVAYPLASIVLAIVAVPLGIRPIRSGRSAGALTAALLMGGYWVLASTGENVADAGALPPIVGMWLPNLLYLALGLFLMRRSTSFDA
jgi:lipopolysaccharide export system permease protein